jgi:phosphoribosylamine--glycine ligase
LSEAELSVSGSAAVTIVVAAEQYPEGRDVGSRIDGIADAEATGALVFHAGTAVRDGQLITNGGRILNVTAAGDSLEEARSLAYAACDLISFTGARYRRDIGGQAVNVAG